MALGDGVSKTNSKRWSTNGALMKRSAATVIRMRSSRGLQEKNVSVCIIYAFETIIEICTNLHMHTLPGGAVWLLSFNLFAKC